MRWLLAHLRANVVAYVALFFALSAGAYAAKVELAPKNSVSSKSIRNGAVKKADLGKDAVRERNIAANAVGSAHLQPGSVASGEIVDGSVHFSDLAPDGQPDRDLDLVKVGPILVDDPPDGAIPTRTLVEHGPVAFRVACQDNGANVTVSSDLLSTEAGHVSTASNNPDRFEPNVPKPLVGNTTLGANTIASSGGYALTSGGHFLNVGIFIVARPTGVAADCVIHASGFGD